MIQFIKFLEFLSTIKAYLSLPNSDWINFAEIFQKFSPSKNIFGEIPQKILTF